ncbi:MAG: methylated-DNA--[protein]-cysteine S-methyltransferase [Armatimonadota bacterium]|nr:methylated-DNA--[protein]-cysteine S-methyltransferase [Armatimonadota bacterium]
MVDVLNRSEAEKIRFAVIETKFGWLGLISRECKLLRLIKPLESRNIALENLKVMLPESACESLDSFGDLPERLRRYFEGERVSFEDVPLDLSGYGGFQARAVMAAKQIPYGSVVTYAQLARMAGAEKAARAAGQAMARNRTPIIVPCHRVVRADGQVGGFAWGKHWKTELLALEGIATLPSALNIRVSRGPGNDLI